MYKIVVHLVGKIFEFGEVASELQAHLTNGAITLFANDDFSDAQIFCVFVINLVAVDEQNHVRVLLDSTGFP